MNAVRFDTLKLARSLEAAGMTAPLAAGTSEALAEALAGGEFATKSDIAEVKHDIAALRSELKAEIGSVHNEVGSLRSEMHNEIGSLRSEMKASDELLRRDMTIKLGSMILIAVGVLLAAMRFMPMR
jgi:hypothetical protein